MATIIAQHIESGAQKLLSSLDVSVERFSPGIIAEVPVKATGLLAGVDARIEFDAYNNPFVVTAEGNRVSLAVVITHQNRVFVYSREGKTLQNTNTGIDIIGSVGFGVSAWFHKIPAELCYKKIANVRFSDLMAVEQTDGQGDKGEVKMPIVLVEVADIEGAEVHFVEVPEVSENQTAKLQAAIRAITENV